MPKPSSSTRIPRDLAKVWGHIKTNHLVMADPGFIVYLDDELDIEWQTTPAWDKKNPADPARHRSLVNRVAELESSEWDYSDKRRTRNYRRQLAEVIANCFENDYKNAEKMLAQVESYRETILDARKTAIAEQISIANNWNRVSNRWTLAHYSIGIAALLLSTLSAAKPEILGMNETGMRIVAWLVAFFTGLLTFLNPEKRASRYRRAWVTLNNQIARYKSDRSYRLEPVLNAHVEGQNLIAETTDSVRPT
jgi:hypothetical protein